MNVVSAPPPGLIRFFALFLALAVASPAFAQVIDSIAPTRLSRGVTTEVIVRGTALDAVSGVAIEGEGFLLSDFVIDSPEQLRFRVGVGDRTVRGTRDLTFEAAEDVVRADALEFVAGTIEVFTATPSTAARGATPTFAVTGRNLDVVTSASLGDGITVGAFTATSPTQASAPIVVQASAFAGARELVLTGTTGVARFAEALVVEGGTPSVTSLTPGAARRGQTQRVVIAGQNLDAVTGIRFGARTSVANFVVTSPTRAEVDVTVGEDASAGVRDITLLLGEATQTVAGRFTVSPGTLSVSGLRPDRVQQGATVYVSVDGTNLDGVNTFSAGPGITASAFAATFPTNIEIEVTVASDAALGLRDVTITGPNGTTTLNDVIAVIEAIVPPPQILSPSRVALPAVQAGAVTRGGFQIENAGELDDLVTIGPGTGDISLISLVDPETGELVNELSFDVLIDEIVDLEFQFRPVERGNFGAIFPVTVRGGEEVGRIIVATTANTKRLLFSLESPTDFGVFEAGVEASLPRVDTLLATGVVPRSRIITGISLAMWRDGEELDATELPVQFETASTVSGDILYWGTTEVLWSVNAPAGLYEGELRFETDDVAAALVPFEFLLEVVGEGGGDVDTDAGDTGVPDAGDAGDAGADADDAGTDAGDTDDAGTPDVADSGSDSGVDAGGDTGGADAGIDAGTDAGGDGGGCTAAGSASGLAWALLALIRRRRR